MYIDVLYFHFLLEREQSYHGKLHYVIIFLKYVLKCTFYADDIYQTLVQSDYWKEEKRCFFAVHVCSANVCNGLLNTEYLKSEILALLTLAFSIFSF